MTVIIYQITCVPTGKRYIGISRKTKEWRWGQHRKEAKARRFDTVFYRAMRKYGPENFTIEVLRDVDDPLEAQRIERELILSLGTMAPNGLNTSTGGEMLAGIAKSPEVAAKISATKRGVPVHTEEGKRRMSEMRRGRKVSDAQLAGIRAAHNDPEFLKMISASSTARWEDPEYRSAREAELAQQRAKPENEERRLAGIQRAKAEGKYKGHVRSPESLAAAGAKLKGRKHAPEHVAKVKAALTGKKRSPEQVARNVASHIDARSGYRGGGYGPATLAVRDLVAQLDTTIHERMA